MNVDSLKSELQQVLNNDVILRKEFNVLKRSLSDYRNQLIMRDEDCKRLQVTIDVLNTKLVVMERDNNAYKAELASYKELRGTITEQLQQKQEEIDARLQEIQSLRDDLNVMASNYEATIQKIKTDTSAELENVKTEYTTQIAELRSSIHYKENGIKEEYENRVTELSHSWSDKEQSLLMNHEEEIQNLKASHEETINELKNEYTERLSTSSSAGHEELASLKLTHQLAITQLEEDHNLKIRAMDEAYQAEIRNLQAALEEKTNTYSADYSEKYEALTIEFNKREQLLADGYEGLLEGLTTSHSQTLNETIAGYEERMSSLVNSYEEKLSNTLIHSHSQNSKLHEELSKVQSENIEIRESLNNAFSDLEIRNSQLNLLTEAVSEKDNLLHEEKLILNNLNSEFDAFKQQASLTGTEQVNELNQQIAALNLSHSDYASELNSRIEELGTELNNLTLLFENTTNTLSETESALDLKSQELSSALVQIDTLNIKLEEAGSLLKEKEEELNTIRTDVSENINEELAAKNLEYEKLLAENTNLIDEINIIQDKAETQEHELSIVKGELEEVRQQSIGKSDYFKETLSNKNFQITNLEANNAALNHEVTYLKKEIAALLEKNKKDLESEVFVSSLKEEASKTLNEKLAMQSEIDTLYTILSGANDKIAELETSVATYQAEIEEVKKVGKIEEQEAFIDRLFKQIDALNDQRMALLDEKEQMASQLLKMNEVIGNISQQVDAERIDVTSLNNHRKNVILANNSETTENRSPMKEQINDLVREIDKCIELLSA